MVEGARHCSGQKEGKGILPDPGLQFNLWLIALGVGIRFGQEGTQKSCFGAGNSLEGSAKPRSLSGTQAIGLKVKRLEDRI